MFKKILSLTLAVMMVLSLSLTSVYAYSDENVIKEWDYSSADKGKVGELVGLGSKAPTDNSKLLSADTEYVFDYSPYRFGNHTPTATTKDIINGYFTMEFSVLLSNTDSFSVGAHLKGADNGNLYYQMPFYTAKNCVKNQWNRVALQYYSDGETTSTLTLFLNGEQVFEKNGIGSVAYFNTINLKAIGGEGAVDDVVSYLEAYNAATASLYTLAEGVSLNSFTNDLVFADGEKVSDIKADIVENDNVTKTFYKDSTYTQILADTDALSRGNVVVITDGAVYNYITLTDKNVVKTASEQKMTATAAGASQTDQVSTVYQYPGHTSNSTSIINGYLTVEADVLFSDVSDISFKAHTKTASSHVWADKVVGSTMDEAEYGKNKYHKIAWEIYGTETKSDIRIFIDGKLFASVVDKDAITWISSYKIEWTPNTSDSFIHLKNIVAYEGRYKADGYKLVSNSNVFADKTLYGLGGKSENDNSLSVSASNYNTSLEGKTQHLTGYTTLEFSALGIDTTAYKIQYKIDGSIGYSGDNVTGEFSSLNQWHRIAFEHYSDGVSTTTFKVYVDGKAIVEKSSTTATTSLNWMRISTTGNMAIDDMVLHQSPYSYNDITFEFSDGEKVSYDDETGKIMFVNGATAEDVLSSVSGFDGEVSLYSDNTYKTKLSNAAALTNTSVLVLKSADGNIFRYVDIRIDDFAVYTYTDSNDVMLVESEEKFTYKNGATVADLKNGFATTNNTTIAVYENEESEEAKADEALLTDNNIVKISSPFGNEVITLLTDDKIYIYEVDFENDETISGNSGNSGELTTEYKKEQYGKTSSSKAQLNTLTSNEGEKSTLKVPVIPYSVPANKGEVTTTEFSFAFEGVDVSKENADTNLQIQGAFNYTNSEKTANYTGTSLYASFNDINFRQRQWNKFSITIYPQERTYTTRINGKIFREKVSISEDETAVINKFAWLSIVLSAAGEEGKSIVNKVALDDVKYYYGEYNALDSEKAEITLKDNAQAGLWENVIYFDKGVVFEDKSDAAYPFNALNGATINSYALSDGEIDYSLNGYGYIDENSILAVESKDGTTVKYFSVKGPEFVCTENIALTMNDENTSILAEGKAGANITAYYPLYKASDIEATLYLAIYEGNKLIDIIADPKTVSGVTEFSVSKELEDIENISVKAIFIDKNMKPAADFKEFN